MDVENTLKTILIDELFVDLPRSEIGLDDGLRDKLALDSLGFSELRAQCEFEFDIKISNQDFVPENFTSLRTLMALIARLRDVPADGRAAK
ncbi:coronafacic acid synthetase, acyl carrier protein component (plasmid) [Azospirillum sp. B510]|uniref:acyl carrier protein n=1 Tax=Azospirillum sp. (strain B510) TaxID=137722 RepID=UPI0001C4B947|nr:phosphopantetheine-binding protein [Azospirillum sp. B510]BAI73718.1 coronafacic acid synthetase, acyl carrier protein component [Azospirillum sp. B510]